MLPGVSFREWLSGSYWRLDSPTEQLAIDLALELATDDLAAALRESNWRVSGTIDAERLASHRLIEGSMCLARMDEGRIPYRFAFQGDDGQPYEVSGHKEWYALAPVRSLTLLVASVYDEAGEEIARATLRFDPRAHLGRWLRSVRLRL